jgi:hypothetical protein
MGQGRCAALIAAIGAVSVVGASPASAWDRPIQLSETVSTYPVIDRHGAVRVVQSTRRNRLEVAVLRWGKRSFGHCAVPGVKKQTDLYEVYWGVNPSGAMAYAWRENVPRPPLRVAAAKPGRCFRHSVVQKAFPRSAHLISLFVAPLGTEIAMWGEGSGPSGRVVLGAGGLGRQLRRTGTVVTPRGLSFSSSFPSIIGGDRILWTWLTRKQLKGDRATETFWASVGARRGGRLGRARKLVQRTFRADTGQSFQSMRVLADSAGGQVAGSVEGQEFWLMTRRPGRPFGALRKLPTTSDGGGFAAAGNGRGDTVFAWEGDDDVYALLRRRNGRVNGPRRITPGSSPRVAEYPSVAIDGTGRAIVAFQAQDAQKGQVALSDIRVAIARRGRGFGKPVTISGARRSVFANPEVAVNAAGRATLSWFHDDVSSSGIDSSRLLMSRGRLDR